MPYRPALPRYAALALGVAFALAPAARGAEPIAWKWSEGDSARYQLTQRMKMAMDAGPAGKVEVTSRNDTVLRWVADEVRDDGSAALRQQTERVVIDSEGPMGQGYAYDSTSEEPPAGMATLVAPMFRAMCEHDLLMTMKPTGELTEIEFSDELAAALDKLPGGAVSRQMIEQTTKQGSMRFPTEPLEAGDTWETVTEVNTPQMGPMRLTTNYTYDGPREVDGRELEVVKPTIRIEALGQGAQVELETKSSDGEILFDRESGRLVSSVVNQTMDVTVKLGAQSITNVVEQSVEMKRLEEGQEPSFTDEAETTEAAN